MNITLGFKYSSKKLEKPLSILTKKALNSSSCIQNKHSACLIKGDKIFSIGINKCIKKIHFGDKIAKSTIHAEINAILQADLRYTKGMDILIIRVNKSRKLQNSRPCNSCIDKLRKHGIRKAYYSNEQGEIVWEFIDDMPKIHISSGTEFIKKMLHFIK
jgi:deoxycytidylate deaminase